MSRPKDRKKKRVIPTKSTGKEQKLSEDAALEIALRDHPEWHAAWESGELPDEIIGENGQPMSPLLHLQLHAIVERQLAADDPKGVRATARELERLGVSRHDVRHRIGAVIAEHLWYISKEDCSFDQRRYLADLQRVVEALRDARGL